MSDSTPPLSPSKSPRASKESKDPAAKKAIEEAKKEAKRAEEEAKKEAKLNLKVKEKEQKRLEKEQKEREAKEKEQKKKEAKARDEECKREAKQKSEDAKREAKQREKEMKEKEKLDKASAKLEKTRAKQMSRVRRHSKYKIDSVFQPSASKVFGVPLAQVMCPKGDAAPPELPHLFVSGINFLQDHLKLEGLFRISGSNTEIQQWKAELDGGKEVRFTEASNPHSVAGLLKLYLRELPEPLFTYQRYDDWNAVADIPSTQKALRMQKIAELLPKMPRDNLLLITEVIRFLGAVSLFQQQNKMSPANIGLVFGPTLIRSEQEEIMNMNMPCDIVKFLVENAENFVLVAGGGAPIVETGGEEVVDGPGVEGEEGVSASSPEGVALDGPPPPSLDLPPPPPPPALAVAAENGDALGQEEQP